LESAREAVKSGNAYAAMQPRPTDRRSQWVDTLIEWSPAMLVTLDACSWSMLPVARLDPFVPTMAATQARRCSNIGKPFFVDGEEARRPP
jgi:hypothetical protein